MRDNPFETQRSATMILVIINVAIYLLECLLYYGLSVPQNAVRSVLALSNDGIAHGKIWQLLTFQFLHALPWPWHVLFNCIALYFFGRAVEEALGRRTFLKLYFLSGFCGGLLQLIVNIIFHSTHTSVVGASAGVAGLVAAFAVLFPERQITLLLFFIIPVTLKARYLLWGAGILFLWGTSQPSGNVAHAAHLGGLLAGIAYLRWGMQAESLWSARRRRRPRLRQRELVKIHSPANAPWQQPKDPSPEEPEEFISREIDPILDKISAHGIQSLTPKEKQILESARARMGKR